MAFRGGGKVSISGSAQNVRSLLGLIDRSYYSQITIKAEDANAGKVYVGGSGVTSTAYTLYLTPGSSYTFGPFPHFPIHSEEVFLVGTPGDFAQIVGVS